MMMMVMVMMVVMMVVVMGLEFFKIFVLEMNSILRKTEQTQLDGSIIDCIYKVFFLFAGHGRHLTSCFGIFVAIEDASYPDLQNRIVLKECHKANLVPHLHYRVLGQHLACHLIIYLLL